MRKETQPRDDGPIELETLHAELAKLPEKYRLPLILHHLEGRSHEESAALMGCSAETVAVRLHRGRAMLRKRLVAKGAAVSAAALAGFFAAKATGPATSAFVATTTHAAMMIADGVTISVSAVSGQTLALSKGAMNMLLWLQVKKAAAIAVIALLVGGLSAKVLVANAGPAAPPFAPLTLPTPAPAPLATPRAVVRPPVATQSAGIVAPPTAADETAPPAAAAAAPVEVPAAAPAEAARPAVPESPVVLPAPITPPPPPASPVAVAPRAPAPAARPAVPRTPVLAITGQITKLGDRSIAIHRQNGQTVTVAIDDATVVKLDDAVVSLADLKPGMDAAALYARTDKPAYEIRARSAAPANR